MSDNINYRDAVVTTMFKKIEIKPAVLESEVEIEPAIYELALDLPFKVYGEMVMVNGKDVTYSYRSNLSLEGQEALVLVSYRIKNLPTDVTIKDETDKVRAFPGFVGETWDEIKKSPVYARHYKITKADVLDLETKDIDGNVTGKVAYTGKDAAEAMPMYVGMCGAPMKVEATVEK